MMSGLTNDSLIDQLVLGRGELARKRRITRILLLVRRRLQRAGPMQRRTVKATAAVSFVGRFIGFWGSLASAATGEGGPFEDRVLRIYLRL